MSSLTGRFIRYDASHLTDEDRDHLYHVAGEVGPGLFRIHRVWEDGSRRGSDMLAGLTAQTVEDMAERRGGVYRIYDTVEEAKADLD